MKTKELFQRLESLIKDQGNWPEIIDYSLGDHSPMEIERETFDLKFDVHFGGNEGIYLSLYLEGQISDAPAGRFHLGTVKTLVESKEALKKMALLGAEFVWEGRKYIEENMDEFIRYGYKITPASKNYSIYVANKERALEKIRYFLEDALEVESSVLVMNLKTRKEQKLKKVPKNL